MTKPPDRSAAKAQFQSLDVQDGVGRVLPLDVGHEQPVAELTPAEEASLQTSLDQAAREEFATDEGFRTIWAKHGL